MYESVAKLPCGEVTVAKLPCGEVTGNRLNFIVNKIFFFFLTLMNKCAIKILNTGVYFSCNNPAHQKLCFPVSHIWLAD